MKDFRVNSRFGLLLKTWGESGYTRPKFRHGWQWCWEWLPLAGRVCAPSSLWARSSWLIYISCLFSSSLNSAGFASLEVEAARLSSTPGAECVWACRWDSEPRVSAVTNKWPVTTPPVCSCISVPLAQSPGHGRLQRKLQLLLFW